LHQDNPRQHNSVHETQTTPDNELKKLRAFHRELMIKLVTHVIKSMKQPLTH